MSAMRAAPNVGTSVQLPTPLPWHSSREYHPDSGTFRTSGTAPYILDDNGRNVACAMIGSWTEPESAAIRDFIVRACNSHDALLSAAEASFSALDDLYDYSDDKGEKPFAGAGQLMETLRAAIAKARQP